jgi:hypothetical protein
MGSDMLGTEPGFPKFTSGTRFAPHFRASLYEANVPSNAWSDLFPRLAVFPLHTIENGSCGCVDPACSDVGKHPDGPWGDIQTAEKRRSRHHPKAGYGIATGQRSGVFVVDCDGQAGVDAFKALGECPPTFTVRRGHGRHYYFRCPDFRVLNTSPKTKFKLAPKVDTRGDGGYIVAPGSPHRSGDTYIVERDVEPADAPEWLLATLREWLSQTPDVPANEYEGDVDGEDLFYHVEVYEEYLRTCPPCVAFDGGDAQLWRVVQYGAYDLALPGDVVLEMIREIYDPRCQPPWGDELERKVTHKIQCAKEHSTRPPNTPIPRDLLVPSEPIEAVAEKPVTNPELAEVAARLKLVWGDWDIEIPPPRYIVKDVIPADTIGMIVAKGSSLKTWMALSIALAVAKGDPWLGHFTVEKGPVLIVDFESGQWQLRHRAKHLGADKCPDLGLSDFPHARIDDQAFWVDLAKVCKAHGVRLVIVDSYAAGAAGVDENDTKAALPLAYAARFTDAVQCAVLFIHHAKKGEGGDERDLVRGTGAIYAGLDWAVTMIPLDDNRTRMRVRNIKPWGPRPEDFAVELTPDGSLILCADASDPAEDSTIEAAIRAALTRPIPTRKLIAKTVGKRYSEVLPHIEGLEARGIIANTEEGYILDDDTKRRARVAEALEGAPCRSLIKLSQMACVREAFLNDLFRKGDLVLSGSQYLFVARN